MMPQIRPLHGRVRIDGLVLTEDLAYKNGPHLSPKIYEEFWLPYQNPIVREVKRHGTGIVCLWTAGNIEALLPMLMDNGINCIWCLERGSGMDPVALRKKYGQSLLLGGGIPKEALIQGRAAIDREIASLLPLIREGGYLPALMTWCRRKFHSTRIAILWTPCAQWCRDHKAPYPFTRRL